MVLWVLCILVVLILLLCLMRVGVRVQMTGGSVTVNVTASRISIQVFPGKAKPEKKQPKEAKPKEKKTEKQPFPKPTLTDIKDAVHTLWPPLKRALGRVGKGVRIAPLDLRVTIGGADDPAAAAQLYGYLNAGVWTAMPVLEKLLDIPDPHIHLVLDFDEPRIVPEGTVGVTFRVGTLLAAAFGIAIPALRWFLRYQKKAKQRAKQETPQPAAST
jgi:predicted outer membrane lipoprotein